MIKKRTLIYNDILNDWLLEKKNIKIQSLYNYEYIINTYLSKTIGLMRLNDLRKENIENLLRELNVAISTKKKLFYIIKSSLNYAYNNHHMGYIDLSNITFKSVLPSVCVLSKVEQKKLESYLMEKPNIRKICVLLCLYTGLRLGEVCALKWEDIDFNHKSLCIKRTVERIKNSNSTSKTILIESTPKSITSIRVVPIPDFIIKLLKVYYSNDLYFILSNSLKLYDPRLLESFYSRLLKKCHIKQNKFHTLRHTFSTRSIESKMDVKTLSEILGHSSVEITLKLYVHPTYEMKKSSIESLVKFMSN